MTPPTTPASVFCWTRSTLRYSWSWWARREMGRVWSHTRPGPVRAARKIPSPPKIGADTGDALYLEGDATLEGSYVAGVDAEGFAGSEVFDDDFAGELEPGDPCPEIFCRRKPSPPKMPAPRDCWKPTPSSMAGVAQRKP